ncbi:hypothetical protein PsYK624_028510 [Phanerochaete sordida]|uniref:Uncharacterized protein n=1 Tax=Phanerochaete sordida TaxID=48140 RepID=A0A9P3L9Q2_9APHY|nr:hypothetical protein PsYK624_028510 [Phanerochaete sordida]
MASGDGDGDTSENRGDDEDGRKEREQVGARTVGIMYLEERSCGTSCKLAASRREPRDEAHPPAKARIRHPPAISAHFLFRHLSFVVCDRFTSFPARHLPALQLLSQIPTCSSPQRHVQCCNASVCRPSPPRASPVSCWSITRSWLRRAASVPGLHVDQPDSPGSKYRRHALNNRPRFDAWTL